MPRILQSMVSRTALAASAFLIAASLVGCETTPAGSAGLARAYEAYHRSDYAAAYSLAKPIADAYGPASTEGCYVTGLAAYQLQNGSEAERYFHQAARGEDRQIVGESMAMIGRIYAGQGRHERAVASYAVAAQRLTGQDRANALYHTALSQQSLGQWREAQINLTMARQASSDPAFGHKVDAQLAVRAWTIQIGAYGDQRNAQSAAKAIAARATSLLLGAPRLVPATDAGGRKLVLVQVGQFPSEANALAARGRLRGNGEVVPLMAAR